MENNVQYKSGNDGKNYINDMVDHLEMEFFPPEIEIVKQFDPDHRSVMIIGSGFCNIFKYFDAKNKLNLGTVRQGYIIGESQALHDNEPLYSVETKTYSAIGKIKFTHFKKICVKSPEFKQKIYDKTINNPFDDDREWFLDVCSSEIDYLKFQDDDLLR